MEQDINSQFQDLENAKELFKANNPGQVEMFRDFVEDLHKDSIAGNALKAGDEAPDFTLKNATGGTVNLREALEKGPVILTWYRGGWCPYCNIALNYLQRYLPDFKAHGAQLIAITPETPDQSMSTAEKHKLEFEVLSDESNEVAAKYAGVHGLPENIREAYANKGVGEHYTDYKNMEFPVPATYVIGRDGNISFAFAESDYRKRADPTEILDALKTLRK